MACEYQITAPNGYIVALNVTEVNMEIDEDFVALFDGVNISDTRLRLFVIFILVQKKKKNFIARNTETEAQN